MKINILLASPNTLIAHPAVNQIALIIVHYTAPEMTFQLSKQ